MQQANEMGMNRTGMDMSPIQGAAMVKGTELAHVGPVRYDSIEALRRPYLDPENTVGSVPVPASLRGVMKAGKEKFKGHNPEVLINKLGQRLAFERAGIRLYEALIFKCEEAPEKHAAQIISIDELKHFKDEETEHFLMVKEVMESLGADPTAMTPDADVSALASLGIHKVLTEPRTTINQCLEAIQTTELTDNAAWDLLRDLCVKMGLNDIAEKFGHALSQEETHAETITRWIREITLLQGSGEEPPHH